MFYHFTRNKSGVKIPKRNLLAESKTDLVNETLTLKDITTQILYDDRVELFCPPGVWYGYKDEWLRYAAESTQQEYVKGQLPKCGQYFYEVSINPERFIDYKHYPDPYKILKIDTPKAFDKFTQKYMMREIPEEWRDWFLDPTFDMPLERLAKNSTDDYRIKPRFINWRDVISDYAGIEIKPRQKKREGRIIFENEEIDSWYNVWTTAGGVVWRPLTCLKLKLLYEFETDTRMWVEAKDIPSQGPPPLPPKPFNLYNSDGVLKVSYHQGDSYNSEGVLGISRQGDSYNSEGVLGISHHKRDSYNSEGVLGISLTETSQIPDKIDETNEMLLNTNNYQDPQPNNEVDSTFTNHHRSDTLEEDSLPELVYPDTSKNTKSEWDNFLDTPPTRAPPPVPPSPPKDYPKRSLSMPNNESKLMFGSSYDLAIATTTSASTATTTKKVSGLLSMLKKSNQHKKTKKPLGTWKGTSDKRGIKVMYTLPKNFAEVLRGDIIHQ